jgi:hypothetical protein
MNVSGRTVQGDYTEIGKNSSLTLGGMFRIWMWRRKTERPLIGISILFSTDAETLPFEGLKGDGGHLYGHQTKDKG